MWFGNLVTMRWWDDLWLNESFATYASFEALSETHDFDEAWSMFCEATKTAAVEQDQMPTTHPVVADAPDIDTAKSNFDEITYGKGSAVLKQLVAWVGRDAFRQGLHAYFARHEWANTELADLLQELQRVSGRDLEAWAEEWLCRSGVNTLRLLIQTESGVYTAFGIEQLGKPARRHRAGIGLYRRGPDGLCRDQRMEVDVEGSLTLVPEVVGLPEADLILINDGDLTYAKTLLDERSRQTFSTDPTALRDPLARSLCWAACWQAALDAELPVDDFLELVCSGVAAETDTTVAQRLLDQARTAAVYLGAEGSRRRRLAALSTVALELAREAAAGSDRQLTLTYAFVATATTAHADVLQDLLTGQPIPGVAPGPELRWASLKRLATIGATDQSALNAELSRDGSAEGRLQHATAVAALPDAQRKAEAWRALTEEQELSNHEMLAIARGFAQPEQAELLRQYTALYFEDLPSLWSERLRTSVTPLFTLPVLYPNWDISENALQLARVAASQPVPEPIRRIVVEKSDFVARALRSRGRDTREASVRAEESVVTESAVTG